ncbi:MAG: hypothetical protein ILA34_00575 [Bacteroidaceae bacterium]|nr:hypothetical protein [Bacteroidaceae bacterium]
MEVFIIFFSLIWSILCIILFFKVWAATNDIADIKNMMQSFLNHTPNINYSPSQPSVVSVQPQSTEETKEENQIPKIEDLGLQPGDYVLRHIDNKEYKIEEVRPNSVLIYLGMMGGYRTLTPDQFTVVKSSNVKR